MGRKYGWEDGYVSPARRRFWGLSMLLGGIGGFIVERITKLVLGALRDLILGEPTNGRIFNKDARALARTTKRPERAGIF